MVSEKSNSRGNNHRGGGRASHMRREGQRLLAAVVLFGLCFAGKALFPQQAEEGAAVVRQVLTSSSQFETAFTDLGEDLSEGKGVAESVGNWCVTVFSPQQVTVQEDAVPAMAASETTSWWEWLLTELRQRLLPS